MATRLEVGARQKVYGDFEVTLHFVGGVNSPIIMAGASRLHSDEKHQNTVLVHYRVLKGPHSGHEGIARDFSGALRRLNVAASDCEILNEIPVARAAFATRRGDIEAWEHIGSRKVRRK
jgi:hypothetical protein